MLMKTGILYFTTCFHGFGILRHVDPFVRMLHIYKKDHNLRNITETKERKDITRTKPPLPSPDKSTQKKTNSYTLSYSTHNNKLD